MTNTKNDENTVVITAHPFEGLANGAERLAKAQLARQINSLIFDQALQTGKDTEYEQIQTYNGKFIPNNKLNPCFYRSFYFPFAKNAHNLYKVPNHSLIKERGLKQKAASELLGVTQPEGSQIANVRLSGFSFDRLYRCLHALDMDIEITVKKHVPVGGDIAGMHVSNLGF